MRELGRESADAKAAPGFVEALLRELDDLFADGLGVEFFGTGGLGLAVDELDDLVGVLGDLVTLRAPELLAVSHDVVEARTTADRSRRIVRAAEVRLEVGRQEHAHRPTTVAVVHADDGRHVDLVDVGSLLAVDLDAHELLVEHLRDRLVLEALAFHHVTPVAGAVADREEDRFLLLLRAL